MTQLEAVRYAMREGEWWTVPMLAAHVRRLFVSCSETSISARIRELRGILETEGEYVIEDKRAGKRSLQHRMVLAADRSESTNRQGDSLDRGSAADLSKSSPQQLTLGSGFASPHNTAPDFSEYPD